MGIFDLFKQIESGSAGNLHGKLTWIVAGLGNPGLEYENTRHNAGFLTMDELAKQCGVKLDQMKFKSDCGEAMLGDVRCLLMKPTTYMNLSGDAIAAAANFYKIPPEQVLVIYDDISLPPGKLRLRRKGSAGGHNGIKSIIAQLGTEEFPRIRVGVGAKPNPQYDLADWVLSKFSEEDMTALQPALEHAADAAKKIVSGDMNGAMNLYSH
ncbi:aminoacyl-tRNA hydrolase [uncultured Ruminococcus sp.]|uniref:aminoacyl-tRNA hydrolase n=1 Tax=uncultured Ruminococcus sp. TaxID=165186 RepID=UPI0025E496D1|nr:aminoacyl-tRNA hydrolase [uncultured Ruminococcus sp.]